MWAILAVKPLAHSKQRLAGVLDGPARRELALLTFEHTLAALRATRELEGVVVVTADRTIRRIAESARVRVIAEGRERGHNAAVAMAARRLESEGVESILTVPSDLPLVQPDDIAAVVATRAGRRGLTLVPSRSGLGTNCLAASPPTLIDFQFGGCSLEAHLKQASAAGIEARILRLPRLGLDIDVGDDLAELLACPIDCRTRNWLLRRSGRAKRSPARAHVPAAI
jgi:2-phospho-L-lactate/phosphoenolpyruvate guanylyltransferase